MQVKFKLSEFRTEDQRPNEKHKMTKRYSTPKQSRPAPHTALCGGAGSLVNQEGTLFLSSRWMEVQFFHFDCFLIMGLVALTSRNLFLKEMAPNM